MKADENAILIPKELYLQKHLQSYPETHRSHIL